MEEKQEELDLSERQDKVTVKQLFSVEKLWRELVLFGILFAALILQGWSDFLLPLFPLLFFTIAILIRALQCGQEINYRGLTKPLASVGIKDVLADRLEFTGILTLFTVLVQGYESLAHPQMAATLAPYFFEILMVTYLIGYYQLFVGLQPEPELESSNGNHAVDDDLTLLRFKVASYSSILIAVFFGLGTIFNILTALQITPALLLNVPGSALPNGTQIGFNGVFIVVLIGGFATAIINLYYLLKNVQVATPTIPLEAPLVGQRH